MRKLWRKMVCCFLIALCFWVGTLIADRQTLREELIRLHVVANSDSPEDQAVKLRVKDAVNEYLQTAMEDISDVELAKEYLRENLPKIQKIASETLEALGVQRDAEVTFCMEKFPKRVYDTFTLPSGVYHSLRITLGEGEGQNWWCVVFPTLCLQATSRDLEAVAAGAGFSDGLAAAIAGEEEYEVRFFFLDMLGKLENIFFPE